MRRFGGSLHNCASYVRDAGYARYAGIAGFAVIFSVCGCMYSFAGGGLPPRIHTVAISSFDNQTASPDLPKELYDQMHDQLERRLGVRDAPADRADAVIRGDIATYDADVPVGVSAVPQQAVTARRRLQITIDVEIVDQSNGHVLYSAKSLRQEADYNERGEAQARQDAIGRIIQSIVEGVQSNW